MFRTLQTTSTIFAIAMVFAISTAQRQCFAPTQCDRNFASCTVGLNCLGSPITMCGFGNGSENGACATFQDDSTVYCQCNSCIGLVNRIGYSCSCGGGPPGLSCPSGTLVSCVPNPLLGGLIGAGIQYSCCDTVSGGC